MTRHATTQRFPRSRTDRRSRLLIALLSIPFLVGVFAAPAATPGSRSSADELADAQAQQRALQRRSRTRSSLIAQLNSSQANLQGAIAQTKDQLNGITDDLAATRRRVSNLVDNIDAIKATYQTLVNQLADLDLQVQRIEAQETAKKEELGDRKAELAQRVREAYEAERTSMLETFLSGASFTDMLADDELPARRRRPGPRAGGPGPGGPRDAAEPPRDGRRGPRGDEHDPPGDGGPEAEARPAARASCATPRRTCAGSSARPKAALAAAARAVRAGWPPTRRSCARRSLRRPRPSSASSTRSTGWSPTQFNKGNIPSQYNGTLRWPMGGDGHPAVRLHRGRVRAADGQLRPLAQRHRHRRPVRHRRSTRRAPAASSTSAGTTPTAPTRPGS